MTRKNWYGARRSSVRWRIAVALSGVVAVAVFAHGGGAPDALSAAVTPPTLESLLQQRDSIPRDAGATPASVDELRARYEELRSRRVDIEGALPPALRTPRSRRPELRDLGGALAAELGAKGARFVDSSRDNPDRVRFEVAR